MTAYTKSTNFATKDTLTSGDPLKIVKGTEINTEFDNIATAVNSKSDTASPTFTGTVTAAALTTTGNTILGDASTDTLNVGNGGLVKDASGNVGIGTASPTQLLDVAGTIRANYSAAGSALIVRSNSAGGGQGAQITMTDTWSSNPAPSKFMRVNASGDWEIVNSSYSQGIFNVTNAGIANATGGYQKNGTTIASIAWGDVTITGLTTSYQSKQITLPNGITFGVVVSIVALQASNDILYIDSIGLGAWSGVQLNTQATLSVKLGNAVAATQGDVRVFYRI